MKERNEEPGPKEEKQKYHTNNLKKKRCDIPYVGDSVYWVYCVTDRIHLLVRVFSYFLLPHLSPAPRGRAPVSPPSSPARTLQRTPRDPPPRYVGRSPRWSRCWTPGREVQGVNGSGHTYSNTAVGSKYRDRHGSTTSAAWFWMFGEVF